MSAHDNSNHKIRASSLYGTGDTATISRIDEVIRKPQSASAPERLIQALEAELGKPIMALTGSDFGTLGNDLRNHICDFEGETTTLEQVVYGPKSTAAILLGIIVDIWGAESEKVGDHWARRQTAEAVSDIEERAAIGHAIIAAKINHGITVLDDYHPKHKCSIQRSRPDRADHRPAESGAQAELVYRAGSVSNELAKKLPKHLWHAILGFFCDSGGNMLVITVDANIPNVPELITNASAVWSQMMIKPGIVAISYRRMTREELGMI